MILQLLAKWIFIIFPGNAIPHVKRLGINAKMFYPFYIANYWLRLKYISRIQLKSWNEFQRVIQCFSSTLFSSWKKSISLENNRMENENLFSHLLLIWFLVKGYHSFRSKNFRNVT